MGILRTDKISGLEKPTAVTRSVLFDGDGDYLSVSSSGDFAFDASDFTVEYWIYVNGLPPNNNASYVTDFRGGNTNNFTFGILNNGGTLKTYSWGNSTQVIGNTPLSTDTWYHIAHVRSGSTVTMYLNGFSDGSMTNGFSQGSTGIIIGARHNTTQEFVNGYISNLRILKGTALYTSNFTPPVHELEVIGDTVLLCCNNPDSAGAASYAGIGTSKTITVNGDAAASTVSPGLTRDFTFGTEFEGVTRFDTQGYFVPPSGTTEQRGRGRGVIMGGSRHTAPTNPDVNTIFYIDIATQGNAVNFGELISAGGQNACVGSSTRGISAGGSPSPTYSNIIDFVTIATTSNATDFGDLTAARFAPRGISNSTRGLFAGGRTPSYVNTIDYITMAALGNAIDFGDLNISIHAGMTGSSPTRGIHAGGQPESSPFVVNIIDFVTIASTGNATDFGDLSTDRKNGGSSSSSTRMVMGGGLNPALLQSIEYLTIATLGNSQSFGDLTGSEGRWGMSGMSNSIRGVFCGGYDPSPSTTSLNTIDFITIASTGDAKDFGDVNGSNGLFFGQSCSDSHGGIS